jgi:hypothetical protein
MRNTCRCQNDWVGSDCSLTTCQSVSSNASAVCTGRGQCISKNICQCLVPLPDDPKYENMKRFYGEWCELVECMSVFSLGKNCDDPSLMASLISTWLYLTVFLVFASMIIFLDIKFLVEQPIEKFLKFVRFWQKIKSPSNSLAQNKPQNLALTDQNESLGLLAEQKTDQLKLYGTTDGTTAISMNNGDLKIEEVTE